jgi:hypothetical protein
MKTIPTGQRLHLITDILGLHLPVDIGLIVSRGLLGPPRLVGGITIESRGLPPHMTIGAVDVLLLVILADTHLNDDPIAAVGIIDLEHALDLMTDQRLVLDLVAFLPV